MADALPGAPAPVSLAFPAVPPTSSAFTPAWLMSMLWPEASAKLSAADLQTIIVGGAEYVDRAAGSAAQVAEGLGCLVANDGQSGGVGVGSFSAGDDVASVLYHLQAQFEALQSVSRAVHLAADELAMRGAK